MAIREELIQCPDRDAKCLSVFHILDSLQDDIVVIKEGKLLQNTLLKHFEGATFMEGRITINFAQVIFIISPTKHLFNRKCRCLSKEIQTIVPVLLSISARSFFPTQIRPWVFLRLSQLIHDTDIN